MIEGCRIAFEDGRVEDAMLLSTMAGAHAQSQTVVLLTQAVGTLAKIEILLAQIIINTSSGDPA